MHGGSLPSRIIEEDAAPILDVDVVSSGGSATLNTEVFPESHPALFSLPDDALDRSFNTSEMANYSTSENRFSASPGSRQFPLSSVSPDHSSPVAFLCDVCGRSFGTKTGLGVHQQRTHPLEYQASLNLARKKARWTDEERRLLALKEAELVLAGRDRVNDELQKIFSNRTLESIKSQRRNANHKSLVETFIQELQSTGISPAPSSVNSAACLVTPVCLRPFQNCVDSVKHLASIVYKEQVLNDLWCSIETLPLLLVKEKLTLYLLDIFPDKSASLGGQQGFSGHQAPNNLSRRQQRHYTYRKTQSLYKKNRSRCINNILHPTSVAQNINSQAVINYWQTLMSEEEVVQTPDWDPVRSQLDDMWKPFSQAEIQAIKFNRQSAPGPDGLTAEDLAVVPNSVLLKIMNLFLVLGEVPRHLLRARTIFIPKKVDASAPSDFRPISVTSFLLRFFHKLLANRILKSIEFDFRQRGFIRQDGCALNTATLEMLIKHQRSRLRDFYMASLDLSKAFDSVSFSAILAAATSAGLPPPFVDYIRRVQLSATTTLYFAGDSSAEFHPTRGVRQGDPLSPILFNLVIDEFLRSIPGQVGIDVGSTRFAALAYADDLTLFATSAVGLQTLLSILDKFLNTCALRINVNKSFGLALRALGKEKKMVVDSKVKLWVQGSLLPMNSPLDKWTYLGIQFSATGRSKVSRTDLVSMLMSLRKAPLKPQQRLFALRFYVIPKFQHVLTLGHTMMGFLNHMDQAIRQEVRRWLTLPQDTPIAYFHAAVPDGGLGIPSFRWTIPLLKLRRFKKIKSEFSQATNAYIEDEIRRATANARFQDGNIHSHEDMQRMWATRLYTHFDGQYLKDSRKVSTQHAWVGDGTCFLTSKDYINSIKLRINALPTRSRTSRGRAYDRTCRGGCSAVETLGHVLQVCHRSHDVRIQRHDAVVNYVSAHLEKKQFVVVKEPRIQGYSGVAKPDIVAVKGNQVFVIDGQVVGDHNLKIAHERKRNKYRNNQHFVQAVSNRFNTNNISFHTITLNYMGVWSHSSADDLITNKLICKSDLKVLSSRVLIGGYAAFRRFSTMTSVQR